jgi:hypothetical protein
MRAKCDSDRLGIGNADVESDGEWRIELVVGSGEILIQGGRKP